MLGRGLEVLLLKEYFALKKSADLLVIDEFDDAIMNHPYLFTTSSESSLEGIWSLKSAKFLGITGTSTLEMT